MKRTSLVFYGPAQCLVLAGSRLRRGRLRRFVLLAEGHYEELGGSIKPPTTNMEPWGLRSRRSRVRQHQEETQDVLRNVFKHVKSSDTTPQRYMMRFIPRCALTVCGGVGPGGFEKDVAQKEEAVCEAELCR